MFCYVVLMFCNAIVHNLQVGNNQVWGTCPLPARSPPEQTYSAPPPYMGMGQMESMMPPPPPDSSKAPGYRSASQRMVNSPIGMMQFFLVDYIYIYLIFNQGLVSWRTNKTCFMFSRETLLKQQNKEIKTANQQHVQQICQRLFKKGHCKRYICNRIQ